MKIGRVSSWQCRLPVIAFAVIGGFMSKALRVKTAINTCASSKTSCRSILNNYVEEVDIDKVMHGAMHGLADGLDPDSAYLDAAQVKTHEKGDHRRHGRPASRSRASIPPRDRRPRRLAGGARGLAAGRLHPRDRRTVDARHHGLRRQAAAARQAGHQGAPHVVARQRGRTARDRLVREDLPAAPVKSRIAAPGSATCASPSSARTPWISSRPTSRRYRARAPRA